MTSVLAVETSSDLCSVALYRDGDIVDVTEKAPREHTQKLLPMIDRVLAETGVSLQDLDGIAYGRGPGSFTGLRISLGMVQGLAYGLDIPLIPVSTLQTIATLGVQNLECESGDYLLVANDARMNEVYACLYRRTGEQLQALIDECVLSPVDFLQLSEVAALKAAPLIAMGDAWSMPEMAHWLGERECHSIQATAPGILQLAVEKLLQGEVVAAENAQPSYLRDSVAWKKRERIRQQ